MLARFLLISSSSPPYVRGKRTGAADARRVHQTLPYNTENPDSHESRENGHGHGSADGSGPQNWVASIQDTHELIETMELGLLNRRQEESSAEGSIFPTYTPSRNPYHGLGGKEETSWTIGYEEGLTEEDTRLTAAAHDEISYKNKVKRTFAALVLCKEPVYAGLLVVSFLMCLMLTFIYSVFPNWIAAEIHTALHA